MDGEEVKRNEKGYFAKGTKAGPGRPSRAKELARLLVMQEVATLDAWRQVCAKALRDALGVRREVGEGGQAIVIDDPNSNGKTREYGRRFLADYLLGRPSQNITLGSDGDLLALLDGLDATEAADVLARAEAIIGGERQIGGGTGGGADSASRPEPAADERREGDRAAMETDSASAPSTTSEIH